MSNACTYKWLWNAYRPNILRKQTLNQTVSVHWNVPTFVYFSVMSMCVTVTVHIHVPMLKNPMALLEGSYTNKINDSWWWQRLAIFNSYSISSEWIFHEPFITHFHPFGKATIMLSNSFTAPKCISGSV